MEKHLYAWLCFEFVHEFFVHDWYAVSTGLVEEDTESYSPLI